MKRKVLPCFMALSMTLTAVPNVAMAEDGSMNEAGTVVETTTETETTTGTEPAKESEGEVEAPEVVDTAEGTPVNNGATEGTVVEATEIQPAMEVATEEVAAKNGVVEVKNEDELKTAVSETQDGVETTILLTDDIILDATLEIPAGKEIKLDLGCYRLSITASTKNVIQNSGELTVENGEIFGAESNNVQDKGIAIYNNSGATVVLNGAEDGSELTVKGTRTGLENYGTAVINGGTVTSFYRNAIYTEAGSETTINGGQVIASMGSSGMGRAVSAVGDLTIHGGYFYAGGSSGAGDAFVNAISIFNGAKLVIDPKEGKTVDVISETDYAVSCSNATVEIRGGNFACNGDRNDLKTFENGSIQIYGGSFLHEPAKQFLAENCLAIEENGKYVVKQFEKSEVIVQNYDELVNALNSPITEPKEITVDADIEIPEQADLTLKEGFTLEVSEDKTFTVQGTFRLNGKMTNNGVLDVTESGFVEYPLHITNNGEISGYPEAVNGVCEISTPMELQWLSCITEWDNENIPEKIVLTADIDLPQDVIFTQIGVEERPYHNSVFDGQNHTISNLQIEAMVDGSLFGTAQEVTIKNLTIDHATVTSTDAYIGALVGLIKENATIDNVHIVNSTVKSPVSYGVGGFAGQIWTKDENARVEFINCSTTNTKVEGYANVGGIWGTSTGSLGTIGIYNSVISGTVNAINVNGAFCGGFGNSAKVQVIGLDKDAVDLTVKGESKDVLVSASSADKQDIDEADKGNHAIKDENGNWVSNTDGSGTTKEIVAKIGSVEYVSLEKAMEDAAARGEEIYLEKEITVSKDEVRTFAAGVKFDPSGKKIILEVGGTVNAKEDIRNVIQVPAGYRLAVSGNETDGFTYTAEKKSSGGSHSYDGYITVINPKNGTVSVSDDWADEDQKITLTITPDKGYVVDKIEIVDLEGDKIDAKKVEDEDNEYTFRMANCDVTVTVTFKEEGKTEDKEETNETEETDKTEETTTPETVAFSDVSESDWFYKGVSYVVENGMMNGVGENQFAPNAPLTREMLAVVLYNMEKQPESTGVNPFADVKADMWYTDAIVWANANSIVAGYDDSTFGLGDSITREQLAAILYRYAQMKGYDVTEKADLTGYADSAAISGYAVEAMQWANANGIVNGMTATTLAPQGTATRAQVATMLMNFCENVVTKAE